MNILFVCSGNTCRSAMAEAIAKKVIQDAPKRYRSIRVASAGTAAHNGDRAATFAQEVASEHGADLSNFTAQQVSPELIDAADVVLCMTNSHKRVLQTLSPQARDKIYLLKEYERHLTSIQEAIPLEVADPFGGDKATYSACYQELAGSINAIFVKLAENNDKSSKI